MGLEIGVILVWENATKQAKNESKVQSRSRCLVEFIICWKKGRLDLKMSESLTDAALESDAITAPPPAAAAAAQPVKARRPKCDRCRRPMPICICSGLIEECPVNNAIRVVILQHPCEAKKEMVSTVPVIKTCLKNFQLFVTIRFNEVSHPELTALLESRRTLVVYPGPQAIPLGPGVVDQFNEEDMAAELARHPERSPGLVFFARDLSSST
jgi:hypothetical protein